MNSVALSGRLGGDPTLNHVGENDTPVVSFSIAEDHGYGTNWFDVEAWGQTAENIDEYFGKGDFIEISGSLETDEYETENGTRQTTKIRASRFGFGGGDSDSTDFDDPEEDDEVPF